MNAQNIIAQARINAATRKHAHHIYTPMHTAKTAFGPHPLNVIKMPMGAAQESGWHLHPRGLD